MRGCCVRNPTSVTDRECQLAFRVVHLNRLITLRFVGPTEGPLRVSDRSKCYRTLSKPTRKSLILRSLRTCQGSGVSSILIGRSIKISNLHRFKRLPIFHHFPFEAFYPCTQPWKTPVPTKKLNLAVRASCSMPGFCRAILMASML